MTKIDHPDADVARATRFLKSLGISGPILTVSAVTGEGLEELKIAIDWS